MGMTSSFLTTSLPHRIEGGRRVHLTRRQRSREKTAPLRARAQTTSHFPGKKQLLKLMYHSEFFAKNCVSVKHSETQ